MINMSEEIKKEFDDLQDRMIERASIYKDTAFDPFYRFVIGESDWEECVNKISTNLNLKDE